MKNLTILTLLIFSILYNNIFLELPNKFSMFSCSKHTISVATSKKYTYRDTHINTCTIYTNAYTQAHQVAIAFFRNFVPEIIRLAGFVEIAKRSVNLFSHKTLKAPLHRLLQVCIGVEFKGV